MAQYDGGPALNGRSIVGWIASLVVVPAVLAGVAVLWPAPRIGADLRARAETALTAAGIGGVDVVVDGRDARLDGVAPGAERAATDAVGGVTGVRAVTLGAPGAPPAASSSASPSAPSPSAPSPSAPSTTAVEPVTFAADSAELSAAAAARLAQVAARLAGSSGRVAVDGYAADTPGPATVAEALSARRAAAVAEVLVAGGVAEDRITATGHGATRPLGTPAASRRVEITGG